MRNVARDDRGLSLIEVLVAVFVFTLLFLMIDGVFSMARRSTAKAELGADVQQNARLAAERLLREIREAHPTSPDDVNIGGSPGARAVVFRSARPKGMASLFCLDVDTNASPLYNAACFTSPGPALEPNGSFAPVWQSYVGYYVAGGELWRYEGDLSPTTAALPSDPAAPPGDATVRRIAAFVASFDVTLSGGKITVRLQATGQETVQGSPLPAQEIVVEGTSTLRNE